MITIEFKKMESYMKVEDVLRYLKLKNNPFACQYQLREGNKLLAEGAHFFKCIEIQNRIDPRIFREMECEVTTHMIDAK